MLQVVDWGCRCIYVARMDIIESSSEIEWVAA